MSSSKPRTDQRLGEIQREKDQRRGMELLADRRRPQPPFATAPGE